jgi:hypothetical protein
MQTRPLNRGAPEPISNGFALISKKRWDVRCSRVFKGGLFTDYLARLKITDMFRPCFLRIETKRFRTALLNAECDVYFGVGIVASDRHDLVHLAPIPWHIRICPDYKGKRPASPADLPAGKWWIAEAGEPEAVGSVLQAFHEAGAKGGRIHADGNHARPAKGEIVFSHETTVRQMDPADAVWPSLQFSAALSPAGINGAIR